MALLPDRSSIAGTPSRATANAGFGALWDFISDRFVTGIATTAEKLSARNALGAAGLSGNETLAGVKTFSSVPVLSAGARFGTATMANVSTSAPLFGARAFGVFDGRTTGTFACNNSGNVTSVTRNSAGVYVVNLTTAMPDVNYIVVATCRNTSLATYVIWEAEANTASAFRLFCKQEGGGAVDCAYVSFAVLRT